MINSFKKQQRKQSFLKVPCRIKFIKFKFVDNVCKKRVI